MKPLDRLYEHNTKGNLWIYILSLLKEGKMHAWNIQTVIEKKFGFKPGRITAYRVLYRLEEQKLVKSETQERRRVYQITDKGQKQLVLAKQFYQEIVKKI
ncbi:PadR family transcriptional regulator [Patescibacteria group bacterium]|nr:PadR family transcriptional regulator [Patescibacteria group bacterium]MBU1876939.1 PadR family transcriptional regulator [Patescibacteria group bacterium]